MRGNLVVVVACLAFAACAPADTVNTPVHLTAPYDKLPPVPPGETIEGGRPISLDSRQQEAVVLGMVKWMKDPSSTQLSALGGARNSRGTVVVCGQVKGRNSAGAVVDPVPFIGVMMGTAEDPDFVVVGIGSTDRDRAEVLSLCQSSGVTHQT